MTFVRLAYVVDAPLLVLAVMLAIVFAAVLIPWVVMALGELGPGGGRAHGRGMPIPLGELPPLPIPFTQPPGRDDPPVAPETEPLPCLQSAWVAETLAWCEQQGWGAAELAGRPGPHFPAVRAT